MISLPVKELSDLGFKKREMQKIISFISVVKPFFEEYFRKPFFLIDLCAGNGLASFWFHFNGMIERCVMVDLKIPPRFYRLKKLFEDYGFAHDYPERDICSGDFDLDCLLDREDKAVVSIHPCSELGDRVIEL